MKAREERSRYTYKAVFMIGLSIMAGKNKIKTSSESGGTSGKRVSSNSRRHEIPLPLLLPSVVAVLLGANCCCCCGT